MFGVLDPRPLLDAAAALDARYGGGMLIAETLAAGLVHGRRLFFGTPANVGRHLAIAAEDLGIAVHVITMSALDTPVPPGHISIPRPMHQPGAVPPPIRGR